MKRIYLFIIFLFFPLLHFSQGCDSLLIQSVINPGPFQVGELDELDGIRNGPDYSGATIYYPLNNLDSLTSIVFVPGYSNTQLTIQNWGPFLASHGIVTMTIGTNTLVDSHIERRDALLDAIITLINENVRTSSPLYNRLDTSNFAVGGFSKGGGGAQLAASVKNNLRAIIALYPWLENATSSDLNHTTPVLIVSGELDLIAPPFLHADIHYNYTPNTTKKLKYEVALAGHDPLSGPNGGGGEVGFRVLEFLKTYLINDTCYCPLLLPTPISASSYIKNIDCININTHIFQEDKLDRFVIRVFDFLGREVEHTKSTPLFYLYNDGSFERKIIIE